MNADCVIVDANSAIKCLHAGRGDLRGRIGPGQYPQFFSPRFLFVELFKHKERLALAAKLTESEDEPLKAALRAKGFGRLFEP